MSSLDQVREHMQVIDAEGTPLGKVDRIEGDRIKLTRDSSGQGSHEGHHHFIPAGLIAEVEDEIVRLSARLDAIESIFESEEGGEGKCVIDGNEYDVSDGFAIIVPAGAEHNVVNVSDSDELKIYTIYSPPHHKDGIVRSTKKDAEEREEDFDGQTTE